MTYYLSLKGPLMRSFFICISHMDDIYLQKDIIYGNSIKTTDDNKASASHNGEGEVHGKEGKAFCQCLCGEGAG